MGEVDDDDAEGSTAQQQLGGFAQRVGLCVAIATAAGGRRGGRHVHDEQRFEVDAACREIGWVQRASAGLNPRGGFTRRLGITHDPHGGGGSCGRNGTIDIARQLEQATRTDGPIQRLRVARRFDGGRVAL